VRCWDSKGQPTRWSKPGRFEMGLLDESDWKGDWIGAGNPFGLVTYVAGKSGKAVRFDGRAQSLRLPHEPALKPSSGITLAAWIKPDEAPNQKWQVIYRKEDGKARHAFALGASGQINGISAGFGIGGQYVEFAAETPVAKLVDGKWHFVAVTYDGSAITIYLDGE